MSKVPNVLMGHLQVSRYCLMFAVFLTNALIPLGKTWANSPSEKTAVTSPNGLGTALNSLLSIFHF